MANTLIQLKKSATPSSVPVSLANGELALNFADGVLYYKAANGSIAAISGTGGGSSYGVVNANGTIILAGVSGDTFAILPGDFITVTGDAINDRITIGANVKVVYDTANAAFNYANGLSVGSAAASFDAANQAGVIANAAYGNANAVSVSANNYAGFMANAANSIASATYATQTTVATNATSANNYAGFMANAANAIAETIVSANLVTARDYTNTSTTAANNYAGFMANAANSYAASLTPDLSPAFNKANSAYTVANSGFDKANTVASDLANTATAANNYAGVMANSANAYAASLTPNLAPAFSKANDAYTIANAAFDKANSITGSTGSTVNVSSTGPTNNTSGTLWFNSDLGRLFVYYVDVDGSQWIDASPVPSIQALNNIANNISDSANSSNIAAASSVSAANAANSAAAAANAANVSVSSALAAANQAGVIANAAFAQANTGGGGGGGSTWSQLTSNTTATAGQWLMCDTTTNAITITLPASPANNISVKVNAGPNASVKPVTMARNGKTIMFLDEDLIIGENNITVEFVYSGTTWRIA